MYSDMPRPKKPQKPAYVVKKTPKLEPEENPTRQPQSQVNSLFGTPSKAGDSWTDKGRLSAKKSGHDSVVRHSAQERPTKMKAGGAPARSLMSIDFSSMRMNSAEKSAPSRSNTQQYSNHSSDEESHSDRRTEWKSSGRRQQTQREPLEGEKMSLWRGRQQSHRAPLIVDMGQHNKSNDLHSMNQPKSLLGDYWTSIASRPASLMDFKAQDRMGHYNVQREAFARHDHFPPNLVPQRSLLPGNRREEASSRKRPHRPVNDGGEGVEKKFFKSEQSQRLSSESSSRFVYRDPHIIEKSNFFKSNFSFFLSFFVFVNLGSFKTLPNDFHCKKITVYTPFSF